VRIVVVDDHKFMRELIISRESRAYQVIGSGEDAASAVTECEKWQPDLLVLDINLPDESGIRATPRIKKIAPKTRILLCTAYVSDECALEAARSGADGFVEKTNTWDDFIEAVDRVSRGERYFVSRGSSSSEDAADGRDSVQTLTPREKEILTLIADAGSSKEIASKLGISVATVEKHRTNLMTKLRVRNVAGLVSFAFHSGLVRVFSRNR
jgi:DNA-binding NarL/FixJ family response regulator